jgi:hypothetical protein
MQINGGKKIKLLRVAAESSHVFLHAVFVFYTLALIAVVIAMCLLICKTHKTL